MEDLDYQNEREALVQHLADFKRLAQDEPEVAEKLGFAGYVQYQTLNFLGNEQRELLQQIADNPPQVLSSELGKIKNLLENDVIPMLEVIDNQQ